MFFTPIRGLDYNPYGSDEPYVTVIKAWRHGQTNANVEKLLSGGGADDKDNKTALNKDGVEQTKKLGKLVYDSGELDVIYSSDLSRAADTAEAVMDVFGRNFKPVELYYSKQLREILHGQFELTPGQTMNNTGKRNIERILSADGEDQAASEELNDKYRFWKIHPLAEKEDVVAGDVVDVDRYIRKNEQRPETLYQLWQRVNREFIRIAKDNPGKTIGVSTHGGVLATLKDGLNTNFNAKYLPPLYIDREIKIEDDVVIPPASKVENCQIVQFKYDSASGALELIS